MAKITVTYHAPKGDNKVCEWGAFTFFDGMPVEIEDNADNAHMLKKMKGNQYFTMGEKAGKAAPVETATETAPEDPNEETEEDGDVEPSDDDPPPFEDYQPPKKRRKK
jgi:hypothetical protein